ncbi:hypothetical protein SAMN02745181_0041 [Rubritalea squalenifaciens DSM 18772]|uniref:Uncharacterized protein n=1 Tax=Rubritalea squalenifaciens DSM 18772 TaxID=1123071 RepID=A0A1M6AUH1_9BACT|nr:hypothetical protein [Rubritalea squalenifaciens]SHI40061.1 hypothetical protein SAMN02745181_0041 [Rubritalea squalenifaciens DSM 18772]
MKTHTQTLNPWGQKADFFTRFNLRPLFICILGMLAWHPVSLQAHPPRKLMKVEFSLEKQALVCKADIHFSQLYALKKKELGDVGEQDHAKILRSLSMNCPVLIDGLPVQGKLVSCKFPSAADQRDGHYHDENEMRHVSVELKFPVSKKPETISVDWKLIPHNEGELKIPFHNAYIKNQVFKVSLSSTSFTWHRPTQE